ncbi:MAG TPA: acyl-CoA dehydrogenase family protein [Candidatus Obscuribacterales bacterium]
MPDLVLAEESKQYKDLAFDFATNEIAVHAHRLDHSGQFPLEIYKKAWQIGLMNVSMPESAGGLGLGISDACVIAEELGTACAGAGTAFWANDLSVARVALGSKEQQKRWLEPLSQKFGLAAYCLRFPAESAQVSYRSAGQDFQLHGNAIIVNGHNADWTTVVAANTADNSATVFLVPLQKLTLGQAIPAMGLKCADVCQVQFDGVQLPGDYVLGTVGGAEQLLEKSEARSYSILAAYAVGIIRSSLENATRYSKERRTMGVPIGRHQAVAFMLADMAKDAEGARFMVRKAAWFADNGIIDRAAALMAKNFACRSAMKAATDAVQVFGGYGYSREYPVEKLMRDAKTLQVYEQSSTTDNVFIARQLVEASL